MAERCVRCAGSKKIAPMGGIYVNCNVCNGVGYCDVSKNQPVKLTAEYISPVQPIINGTGTTTLEMPTNAINIPSRIHEDDIEQTMPNEIDQDSMKVQTKRGRKKYTPYNPESAIVL